MIHQLPLLAGLAFCHAGFVLLGFQILAKDLITSYKNIRDEVCSGFGHDTCIFPDHVR